MPCSSLVVPSVSTGSVRWLSKHKFSSQACLPEFDPWDPHYKKGRRDSHKLSLISAYVPRQARPHPLKLYTCEKDKRKSAASTEMVGLGGTGGQWLSRDTCMIQKHSSLHRPISECSVSRLLLLVCQTLPCLQAHQSCSCPRASALAMCSRCPSQDVSLSEGLIM